MAGLLLLAGGCGAPAPAPRPVTADPTAEAGYGAAVAQLAGLNRRAAELVAAGDQDAAAKLIQEGQPVAAKLLAAPRPTLAAMEAASDSDLLYARMLLANRNYGWARLQFQKDQTRWRLWRPQTAETARRLQVATAGLAECDRQIQ